MKKVLQTLVLSLALVLFALPVLAEGLDLQAMSTEDLISLQAAVNKELAARNFAEKEVTVPPGTYIIGEDIPAGNYSFRCDDDMAAIYISDASGRHICGHSLAHGESVGKQPLENGQTIQISYGSVVFMPYRGLGF